MIVHSTKDISKKFRDNDCIAASIKYLIFESKNSISIAFVWTYNHHGLKRNEYADKFVKTGRGFLRLINWNPSLGLNPKLFLLSELNGRKCIILKELHINYCKNFHYFNIILDNTSPQIILDETLQLLESKLVMVCIQNICMKLQLKIILFVNAENEEMFHISSSITH